MIIFVHTLKSTFRTKYLLSEKIFPLFFPRFWHFCLTLAAGIEKLNFFVPLFKDFLARSLIESKEKGRIFNPRRMKRRMK